MDERLDQALREAGRMMLSWQSPRAYAKGAHADYVTEADIAVQGCLMERLARAYPGAAFFAEEKKGNRLTDDLTFIIDPIDGTLNYMRQRASSMISVGAVENRRPVFGAVYDPYHDRMYHAERGRGAYCDDERLAVSDLPFAQALIGLGTSPYNTELAEKTGRSLAALLPRCADVRRTGAATLELTDIACGRSDGMFEWVLQPWDYCAGTLLIEEAGGRCGNILGGDATYDAAIPYLAASARCFDTLREILGGVA